MAGTDDRTTLARRAPTVGDRELRLLAENLPLMAWLADADGRLTWFNRRWIEYTGLDLADVERDGLERLHDPAHYPEVRRRWAAAVSAGQPDEMPFPIRGRDGRFRWFRTRVQPLRDEHDRLFAWFGTNEDVTEQRAALQASAESDARFEELARLSPDALFVTQRDRLVFVNEAAARMMRGGAEDLIGRSPFEFIDEPYRDLARARLDAAARTGERNPIVEQRWTRLDGTGAIVEVASAPIRWGGGDALQVMARDVTERKESERRLRSSEERLTLAQEAGGVGLWDWDVRTGAVVWSEGYYRVWRLDAATLPSFEAFMAAVAPGAREEVDRSLAAALEAGTDWSAEIPTADTPERWIAVRGRSVIGVDGRPERMIGVCYDITERKRSELAARAAEERLRLAVEGTGMATWDVDLETMTGAWSPRRFEMFGYPAPDGLAAPYEDWLKRIHPEDAERARAAAELCFAEGIPYDITYRIRRADTGETRWLKSYGSRIAGPDGRPTRFVGVSFDITDVKRAETELRDAQEGIRLALAAGRMSNWDWDLRSNDVVVQGFSAEVFGYAPGSRFKFDELSARIHPDDVEGAAAITRAALERGEPYEAEMRFVRGTGEVGWLATFATPLRGDTGAVERVVGVTQLVTERKLAEQRLRLSEERLRDITDAMPVLISYVDAGHRFRFANRAYEAWFGRPLDEIVDRHLREVMGEAVYEARRPFVERALAGETVTYDVDFPHASGRRSTIVQHIPHRGPDGSIVGIYALVQDVTDQKAVEAALRASRDRLAAVLDATPAAILIATDPSCRTIEGNRRATELMRMDPHDNMSRSDPTTKPEHFRVFSADGRELAPHELPVQRAARGEELWRHEERVEFADGSSVHLLGNAVPLRDDTGAIAGSVGAFIDITERKRWEEHQRLLINELNHRVKNTLAIVQGLAQQSFRRGEDPDAARANFEGRLEALSAAHNILTRENWEAASIGDIAAAAAEPFGSSSGRITAEGPDLRLQPKTAVSLALALHELATNAVKYGALSVPEGRVEVRWRVAGDRLNLVWRECGGPPVEAPTRRGFGTRMIERGLATELGGEVRIDFRPTGLVCEIDAPLPATAV